MKFIIKLMFHLFHYFDCIVIYCIYLFSKKRDQELIHDYKNKNVLIIAPHPDDESIGCGGTIHNFTSQGSTVVVMLLTDGFNSKANKNNSAAFSAKRKSEFHMACQLLGVTRYVICNMTDRNLMEMQGSISKAIDEVLTTFKPDLIFAPFPIDFHPDHIITSKIIVNKINHIKCKLFLYSVLYTLPASYITHRAKVSLVLKKKIYAVYKTQEKISQLKKICLYERIRSFALNGRGFYEYFFLYNKSMHDSLLADVIDDESIRTVSALTNKKLIIRYLILMHLHFKKMRA